MIAYELLERANGAGLHVSVDGGRLRVRGPHQYADLARQLIENKAAVISFIASSSLPASGSSAGGDGDETSPFPAETGVSSPLVPQEQSFEPATADELRYWLGYLREAGCRIQLKDGLPQIAWCRHLETAGRLRDWQVNLGTIAALLKADAQLNVIEAAHNAVSRQQEIPPNMIIADPAVTCRQCTAGRVLRELRTMTGGVCWSCWERRNRVPTKRV